MPVSPYSRYRNLPTLEITHPIRGPTRSLPIRRVPVPTPVVGRQQHRFAAFETPDLLALQPYGREDLYWYLLDANGHKLPDNLQPGEMLTLPPLSFATRIQLPGR